MAAITPEIDSSVRFSCWYEERGVARSTAFKLLALSGLELEKRRVEGSRSPVSFLSADQQEKLDFLADQLEQGKTMADLETAIKPSRDVSTPIAKPSQDVSALADPAALVTLAGAMAAQLAPAPDPMRRAKALAEAADHALVLTNDELEALGVKGVDKFADGDLAYGYCFHKHNQRNRVLWTVERAIAAKPVADAPASLAPAKADKRVGFDVAALMPAVTVELVSLPYFSC